jgi:four helix bundle protein
MPTQKRMQERTYEFGCAVIAEFKRREPADEAERVLWKELLRAQTSLATNSAEADGAHSRRDFIQKFQIALKEARECLQLLELLTNASPMRATQLTRLSRECDQIIAILVASLRTAKRNEAADPATRRR